MGAGYLTGPAESYPAPLSTGSLAGYRPATCAATGGPGVAVIQTL